MASAAEATSPTLSLSLVPPATLRFSWPTNFVNWQLMSTTNLSSGNWQAVTQAVVPLNNVFVVLFPSANKSGFFRLQQTNSSGGCVFQATPPVINSGQSSTLTWCEVAGEIYRLSPGPGIVTGGSAGVSPTVTTVYTLTASNALGVVTNFATVIVGPCGFASVSNWDATLTFSYTLAPSAPGFSFNINRQAQATFRLTPFGPGVFAFNGSASGLASINDREDDSTGSLIINTTVGLGPPNPLLSAFVLGINCTSNTFNLSAIVAVDAIDTETDSSGSTSFARTAIAGQVSLLPHPLPLMSSTISGSAVLPVLGPFTIPAVDYYIPNDSIANDMWINGVITDATAGTASVSWSITPVP
jgi:hypothetical protein